MVHTLRFSVALGAVMLASAVCSAEQAPCADPDATLVATVTMTETAPLVEASTQQTTSHKTIWDVLVERTSGGGTTLFIPAESIRFTGGLGVVGQWSTEAIFAHLALVSIQNLLLSGDIPVPLPGASLLIRVRQAACVERTGSGVSTMFAPCNQSGGCSVREFVVAVLPGSATPTITPVSTSGPACVGVGCESTVGSGQGVLSYALLPSSGASR